MKNCAVTQLLVENILQSYSTVARVKWGGVRVFAPSLLAIKPLQAVDRFCAPWPSASGTD